LLSVSYQHVVKNNIPINKFQSITNQKAILD